MRERTDTPLQRKKLLLHKSQLTMPFNNKGREVMLKPGKWSLGSPSTSMFHPYSYDTYPHHIKIYTYAEYNRHIQIGATCTQSCWVQVRQSFNFIWKCIDLFQGCHLHPDSTTLSTYSSHMSQPCSKGVHFSTSSLSHKSRYPQEFRDNPRCGNHTICLIYA